MIRPSATVLFGVLLAWSCAAQEVTPAAIVQQFFPPRLVSGSDLTSGFAPGALDSNFVATDFDKSNNANAGRKYLVAAYSNAWRGAIRVLQRNGNDWSVASETPIRTGSLRGIELRDLDGDGIPEVAVSFATAAGRFEATWLFQWSGSRLISLLDAPGKVSATTNPSELDIDDYLDLDGDGKSEVIARTVIHDTRDVPLGGDEPPPDTVQFSAYKISGGFYQPWKDLVAYKDFVPHGHHDSGSYVETFSAPTAAAHYVLRIVRSGFSKSWSIKSATIRLNGAVVADESVFRQKLGVITVPVGLQADNALAVSDLVVEGDESTTGQAVRDIPRLVIAVEAQ
jgi:hypothetical protein